MTSQSLMDRKNTTTDDDCVVATVVGCNASCLCGRKSGATNNVGLGTLPGPENRAVVDK